MNQTIQHGHKRSNVGTTQISQEASALIKKQLEKAKHYSLNTRNVIGKKHSTSSTQKEQTSISFLASRYSIKQQNFDNANLELKKGSIQAQQPAYHSNMNVSLQTHKNRVSNNEIPHIIVNHVQTIKNLSQNRMTPSNREAQMLQQQQSWEKTKLVVDQISTSAQLQTMNKQSRNYHIPKSSSHQNPSNIGQQNSIDNATITYKRPKNNTNLNQNGFFLDPTLAQLPKSTQNKGPNNHIVHVTALQHQANQEYQLHSHLMRNPTLCETGASMDLCGSISIQSQFFAQRPQSNMAYTSNNILSDNKLSTTELTSLRSSVNSSERADVTAAASLVESSVGVQLPTSKIDTAVQKHQLNKSQAKDLSDERENIINPKEVFNIGQELIKSDRQMLRSTILDHDLQNQSESSSPRHIVDSSQDASVSSQSSFNVTSERDGILPLLEGFVKECDLASIRQFQCLIKGEIQKALLYRAIEFKQVEMLKYLLIETSKISMSLNLLHIACRQKCNNNKTDKELDIIKTIMKHDRYADLNAQDTYVKVNQHQTLQVPKKYLRLNDKTSKRAPLKNLMNLYNNKQNDSKQSHLKNKSGTYQSQEQHFKENNYYFETEPSEKKKKIIQKVKETIEQYESIMDFCNKQEDMNDKSNSQEKKYMIFKEEEFEKVVEFTESDEEGSLEGKEDQSQQTLQFCEEIEEISDGSLQNNHLLLKESKIGPESFEPISLLGQGSFGEVYLVKKKDTDALYAMKVLQKQRIMGQNLVKYAITERNVLSYTRHPFIVGLNYAFQTRDRLFLILDYCPGGDLGKVLSKEKRLSEDRARIYLSEILLALEDLHQRDIIFRDLKPDNVVLDQDGHVMLTDFGLSKEGVLDNQAAKSFCGSVAYLAPEMLKRTGHGKSVDWYLLGVLLYEMLVGIPPYFNNNKEKLFQNIQRGPLLIPSQLSKEAKTLLIGLLSKNSMKRLGAGLRDAEEIKEHEFFKDINWEDVHHKRLNPPKPDIKEIKHLEYPYTQLLNELRQSAYGDINEDENRLAGWSFVTPSVELLKNKVASKNIHDLPSNLLEQIQNERQPIPIIGEARLLNLSPEKAKEGNLTIHDKLHQMTNVTVNQQMGTLGLATTQSTFQVAGPMRLSNREFVEEFHKIYHRQDYKKDKMDQQRGRQSQTGQGYINFDLQGIKLYPYFLDELLEAKIREVTEDVLKKSQGDIHQRMNQKTKLMRDYIDIQLQKNGHALNSLQDDVRSQERRFTNSIDINGSYDFKKLGTHSIKTNPHIVQTSTDDFKTKALKKSLAHDIKLSMMANQLQCKPIEGHDLPLSELERQTLKDFQNKQEGKAQLLEVENIESTLPNEIKDNDVLLSLLLPNKLKRNTMQFLDIQDLKDVQHVGAPKTQAQIDRENYEELLERDRREQLVTDEQRQKTIKCLLKILDYQLKDAKDQAISIEQQYKNNDKHLKDFEMHLKKEENRILIEDIHKKMAKAKKEMYEYDKINGEEDDCKELVDIADLMVENKLLLDRVDALLGKDAQISEQSTKKDDDDDEDSELTESYINRMYNQFTKKSKSKPKFHPASINVQFGKPIVKSQIDKNIKFQVKKRSKSRPVKTTESAVIVKVLSEDQQKIKMQRKQELKKKIEKSLSPTRFHEIQMKSKEGRRDYMGKQHVEKRLKREVNNAMTEMANVLKVAFNEDK